jgi:hypothetical protein
MSKAHEMTIALSKNSAQSASIIAAPLRNFEFRLSRRSLAKAGIWNFAFKEDILNRAFGSVE